MMKLYNLDGCPYCRRVRNKLAELQAECEVINVPGFRQDRAEVFEVSGQYLVPTLVTDEGLVISNDDDAIIAYLEQHCK
jgi:glutaredoxin 3